MSLARLPLLLPSTLMRPRLAWDAEAQTFLASLRTALGLQAGCTLEACAKRLEQLLADK